jgi:hypothetical protein
MTGYFLSGFCFSRHNDTNTVAVVLDVIIVHSVEEGHYVIFAVLCIYAVLKSYKTAAKGGQQFFQVMSGFKVVSSKTTKVFNQHKIDFAAFCIGYHFLERRSLEMGSRESIVNVDFFLHPTRHHSYEF